MPQVPGTPQRRRFEGDVHPRMCCVQGFNQDHGELVACEKRRPPEQKNAQTNPNQDASLATYTCT